MNISNSAKPLPHVGSGWYLYTSETQAQQIERTLDPVPETNKEIILLVATPNCNLLVLSSRKKKMQAVIDV